MTSLLFFITLYASAIDLRDHRLPDWANLCILGLAVLRSPVEAWAVIPGFIVMGLIYWLSGGQLGFGDVKLFACLSAYLGSEKIGLLLGLSFGLAALGAIWLVITKGPRQFAMGPWICLSALLLL